MDFKLRKWTLDDVDALVKHANNFNIAKNLSDGFPFPYSENDAITFISRVSEHDPTQIFAIDINGEAVGSIGVYLQGDVYRKNAELGYFIAEEHQRKGIIPQAIKQVVKYTFETFDLIRIYAKPFGSNIPSQKVLEKTGFVLESKIEKILIKNNVLEDELIYGIRP